MMLPSDSIFVEDIEIFLFFSGFKICNNKAGIKIRGYILHFETIEHYIHKHINTHEHTNIQSYYEVSEKKYSINITLNELKALTKYQKAYILL